MNHLARLEKLRAALGLLPLDALLVTHLANVRYLCGFTGSAAVLLVSRQKNFLFTDGRYLAQARAEVAEARIIISRKAPVLAAAEWLGKNISRTKSCRLGIDGDHLTIAERSRMSRLLPARVRLRQAPPLLEQSRMVKDAEEIDRLRAAVLLGASLFDVALTHIRPGVTEIAVAAEMEYAARRAGAEGMSFETIIASGARSALPHGCASRAVIPRQGFVVCDFGVILAGYCSDMTRTVYVGSPPDEARQVYESVREAQQSAVEAVRPGATLGQVDRAARSLLRKNRLARYFTHSTGHGVGLEIHEAPRVAAGQIERLQPGMVITIEPGIYLPGKWGVRIEDMVVVTERGCEVLTPTGKELIAI